MRSWARDEIRSKAKEALAANLAHYHIIVDDIYIANTAFSSEFQAAIEAKQVAQQQVQTEQQILAQKKIQADQAVAQAQGQADSNVKLAEGRPPRRSPWRTGRPPRTRRWPPHCRTRSSSISTSRS